MYTVLFSTDEPQNNILHWVKRQSPKGGRKTVVAFETQEEAFAEVERQKTIDSKLGWDFMQYYVLSTE